jgi:hypothetical protein
VSLDTAVDQRLRRAVVVVVGVLLGAAIPARPDQEVEAARDPAAATLRFEVREARLAKARSHTQWDSMRLSPDGQHVAYVVGGGLHPASFLAVAAFMGKMRSQRMVLDDQVGPSFAYVDVPVFSPDGRRLAYKAMGGTRWESLGGAMGNRWQTVVVDGVEGPRYTEVSRPVFSADGAHVSYRACREEWKTVLFVVTDFHRQCVQVVDGEEQ